MLQNEAMPTLSINIGSSYVSFLYYQQGEELKSTIFPYVYSKNLYGHLVNESRFYSEIIKNVAKTLKFSTTNLTVLVNGFPEAPKLDLDVKLYSSAEKSLASFSEYNCLYIGHFKFLEAHSFIYACNRDPNIKDASSAAILERLNNESNISIYPQVNPTDELKRFDMDTVARLYRAETSNILDPKKPVVFSGYSFYKEVNKSPYLTYLLALDLVKEFGTFELKIDEQNIIPNLGLIKLFSPELFNSIGDYKLMSLGTLLNSPAYTECLFETDYGTSQIIDVEKDKLFFIPLEEGTTARIVAKSSVIGVIEKTVKGGKLGFIIDTRDKSNPQMFSNEYFEKNYTTLSNSIREILEGLYVYTNS